MHNSNNSALSKDTIFGASNHTDINSVFNSTSSLEDFSVAKAKEAVQVFANLEQLRKAVKIFNERKPKEQLPANITEAPKFHEPLDNQIENPRKQVQESFARRQVARAKKYNVPYSFYTVDI